MTKVNQTGDDQSLNTFGLAFAKNNAFAWAAQETASASTSTSITGSGTAAHTTDDAKGQMIVAASATGWTGNTIYGVVQSVNAGTPTAPVYTVDRWYTLAGATSGSTPFATGPYLVLPVAPPFWFVALTDSTSAVAATSTGGTLGGTELTTNGLARQIVTSVTRTAGSAITYVITMATTFTYTAGTAQAVGRAALVNSLVASKDFAYFIDQINSGVAATVSTNGDTLTITYSITVG